MRRLAFLLALFATLAVVAPASAATLTSVTLSDTMVSGGDTVSGTVRLDTVANTGGQRVNLTSSNPAVATVPSSVMVASGRSSEPFDVTTAEVSSESAVTITAESGGVVRTATVTVTPPRLTNLTITPSSVGGGESAEGTVYLDTNARGVGAVIQLSDNSANVTVPASVTVPTGRLSVDFVIRTTAVATSQTVTVTATQGSATETDTLEVNPIDLTRVSVAPSNVTGGKTGTGTGTLNGPAPAGGLVVALSSDDADATVPASVTVPAGETTATFAVTTSVVDTNTLVTITASRNDTVVTTDFVVVPAALSEIDLAKLSTPDGLPVSGTVFLTGAAGTDGVVVELSSSNTSLATVPATVTVPAGANRVTFDVTTIATERTSSVVISATVGDDTESTRLTVNRTEVSSLVITPAKVQSGQTANYRVTLTGPAPAGGAVVALTDSSDVAGIDATVTVPAGETFKVFTFTAGATDLSVRATIRALYGDGSATDTLLIDPSPSQVVQSVTFNPNPATGGRAVTGTVTLDSPARGNGVVVTLKSARPAVVSVVSRVTVPAGERSVTFSPRTAVVTERTSVVVTASIVGSLIAGNGNSGTLVVAPPGLDSLVLSETVVVGGAESLTGTLTLTAPAPAGGALVTLRSTNPAVILPSSVRIAKGLRTATFDVSTSFVGEVDVVTVTAKYGTSTATDTYRLEPVEVTRVVAAPGTVNGGETVEVTVTINAAPPAGAAIRVELASDDPALRLPRFVDVPAGRTSATVEVTARAVSSDTAVEVTASLNGSSESDTVTVRP